MIVKYIGWFNVIPENEKVYYSYLQGYIESIDPHLSMLVNKSSEKIAFRITPSDPNLLIPIMNSVKELHTKFSIKVDFSKSMKAGSSISFNIPLENNKPSQE
jgi:hypothetical protein